MRTSCGKSLFISLPSTFVTKLALLSWPTCAVDTHTEYSFELRSGVYRYFINSIEPVSGGTQQVALTYVNWVGCWHTYVQDLMYVAFDLQRLSPKPLTFYVNARMKVPMQSKLPVELSKTVPVCCSGGHVNDDYGHVPGTPCRDLLDRQPGMTLVRIGRAMPSFDHSEGCVEDFICPDLDVGPWHGDWCCSSSYGQYAVLLDRATRLRTSYVEPLTEWPPSNFAQMPWATPFWRGITYTSCMFTFIRRLPELAALAHVSDRAESQTQWVEVEQSLHRCDTHYSYKYVEYAFNAAAFLKQRPMLQEAWREVPQGELMVRLCVPSVTQFSVHRGAVSNPECQADSVGPALLALVFAYRFKGMEAILAEPPPSGAVQLLTPPAEEKYAAFGSPEAHDILQSYFQHHRRLRIRYGMSASAARPRTPPGTTVAICITGLARTLNETAVYSSIRDNVVGSLGPGVFTSIFHVWTLEEGRSLSDFASVLGALPDAERRFSPTHAAPRKRRARSSSDSRRRGTRVPQLKCALPSCVPQFVDLRQCLFRIEKFETQRTIKFDWVVRIRSDTIWHTPLGPLSGFDRKSLYLAKPDHVYGRKRYLTYLDKFALAPRELADVYFDVLNEPNLCFQAENLVNFTWRCQPYFQKGYKMNIQCECFIDARLERLNVPVISFNPVVETLRPGNVRLAQGPRG